MNGKALFIGLDFGSDSVRAIVVDENGEFRSTAVKEYPRWKKGLYSNPSVSQFRQHPLDYLEAFTAAVKEAVAAVDVSLVKGIGIDTTGSTPCAVDSVGVPLALKEDFADDPDAMFVLWKDHTAIDEADRINEVCKKWHTDYTAYSGGVYSSEWFWAKYLHILRNNEKLRKECNGFVEHCDWMASLLTGTPVKAARCPAGHKAMWHASWGGLPPEEFWCEVDPLLSGRVGRLYKETFTADTPAGTLTAEWADKLGLPASTVVACGVLDGHAGAVGAGIKANQMVKIIGTSTTDVIVAENVEECIKGICGQVDGSVIPGMTGLEAGQSAFGDIFAWFKSLLSFGGNQVELSQLEAEAVKLPIDGTVAVDWMNGRRTPFVDPHLQGAVFGLNLGSSAPELYRSLVEAACFGARRIAEHFAAEGVKVDEILALGGIARKSPFVMQSLADIMQKPIKIVTSDQACALGAAMFGAEATGYYSNIAEAVDNMNSGFDAGYMPILENVTAYNKKYAAYLKAAQAVEFFTR